MAPLEFSPIMGWILAKQAEFYRMLSDTIREAKQNGSAAWTLLLISFTYGVFQAAGPGHGGPAWAATMLVKLVHSIGGGASPAGSIQ